MDKRVIIYRILIVAQALWLLSGPAPMAHAQYGRNTIRIVGSSTVYPFASLVAETFADTTSFKRPAIESTGSGGGFQLFCAGVGMEHPDINNASRRMKPDEFANCVAHGVDHIVEIKIGYDGIVLANSKQSVAFSLTRKDIFLALASTVPDPADHQTLVSNPYQTWHAINPRLPDIPIRVLGPSPTSGTRDAFLWLAMKGGADQMVADGDLKTGSGQQHFPLCTIRQDGTYIEEGENDALIVHKLEKHTDSLGIFGFSFLIGNNARLQGSRIDGVSPTVADIASGRYSLSRPLFIYVKMAHVDHIPGIREFLELFTSERMWGPQGMLPANGLVPMTDPERSHYRDIARRLPPLVMQ